MPTTAEPIRTCNFDQVMTRVTETFPGYRNGEWSQLEKSIFNGLLANVIQRHGPATITVETLESLRDDMADVIRQYHTWQSGP
jgi:uncharacterized protein (DUF2267 family)